MFAGVPHNFNNSTTKRKQVRRNEGEYFLMTTLRLLGYFSALIMIFKAAVYDFPAPPPPYKTRYLSCELNDL